MTLVKCDYQYDYGEGDYCQYRDENGFCSLPFIWIKTGDEGYAKYEACCEHPYDPRWWYNREYSEFIEYSESLAIEGDEKDGVS